MSDRENPDGESMPSPAGEERALPPDAATGIGADPAGEPKAAFDTDAAFEDIIARWDAVAEHSGSDGLPDKVVPRLDPSAVSSPLPGPATAIPDSGSAGEELDEFDAASSWRGYSPPEVEEHFEPPTPVLPPAHDVTYWLAVLGLTLGPLVVLWAAVFSRNPDPGWWVLLGIIATVVGFGLLVLRGSGDRDPDDNGARV